MELENGTLNLLKTIDTPVLFTAKMCLCMPVVMSNSSTVTLQSSDKFSCNWLTFRAGVWKDNADGQSICLECTTEWVFWKFCENFRSCWHKVNVCPNRLKKKKKKKERIYLAVQTNLHVLKCLLAFYSWLVYIGIWSWCSWASLNNRELVFSAVCVCVRACVRACVRVFNTWSTMTIYQSRDNKETDLKQIIKVDKFLSIPVTNLHIPEKET